MRIARFAPYFLLIAILVSIAGCSGSLEPDPLSGWKPVGRIASILGDTPTHISEAIAKDYLSYIESLPPEERDAAKGMKDIRYWEDRTGQHAVQIRAPLHGMLWEYIIFYDQTNKRIKATKYKRGEYMS